MSNQRNYKHHPPSLFVSIVCLGHKVALGSARPVQRLNGIVGNNQQLSTTLWGQVAFRILLRMPSGRTRIRCPSSVLRSAVFFLRAFRKDLKFESFTLTVAVTTMGYRNYSSPLLRPPLRTVPGKGNDPT